jgi:hypothetical protein
MADSEARLRRELEAVNGKVTRLSGDMLLLENVPTDPQRFSKAQTNLLVVATGRPRLPYLVLVDEDLRYGGGDPFLNSVFADPSRKDGWRPLLLAPGHRPQADLAAVARGALRLLGFAGDEEPGAEELTDVVLPAVANYLETRYGLDLATESLRVALALSGQLPGTQPGKVIRLLDSAMARARRQGLSVLGPDDVFDAEP